MQLQLVYCRVAVPMALHYYNTIRVAVAGAGRLRVPGAIVEMDGDEMSRVMADLVKQKLLLPFLDLVGRPCDPPVHAALSIHQTDRNCPSKPRDILRCLTMTDDPSHSVRSFHQTHREVSARRCLSEHRVLRPEPAEPRPD